MVLPRGLTHHKRDSRVCLLGRRNALWQMWRGRRGCLWLFVHWLTAATWLLAKWDWITESSMAYLDEGIQRLCRLFQEEQQGLRVLWWNKSSKLSNQSLDYSTHWATVAEAGKVIFHRKVNGISCEKCSNMRAYVRTRARTSRRRAYDGHKSCIWWVNVLDTADKWAMQGKQGVDRRQRSTMHLIQKWAHDVDGSTSMDVNKCRRRCLIDGLRWFILCTP